MRRPTAAAPSGGQGRIGWTPEASTWHIVEAAVMFALPLVVLLLPRTRPLFAVAKSKAAG